MLKHSSYITWIIVGVVIYYVFVLIYFYRTEFQYMLRSRKEKLESQSDPSVVLPQEVAADQPYNISEAQDEEDSLEADELSYRLRETISEIAKRDYLITEFLQLLRMILNEYPRLKNTDFRKNITELLVSECGKHDKLHITEQEADELWD